MPVWNTRRCNKPEGPCRTLKPHTTRHLSQVTSDHPRRYMFASSLSQKKRPSRLSGSYSGLYYVPQGWHTGPRYTLDVPRFVIIVSVKSFSWSSKLLPGNKLIKHIFNFNIVDYIFRNDYILKIEWARHHLHGGSVSCIVANCGLTQATSNTVVHCTIHDGFSVWWVQFKREIQNFNKTAHKYPTVITNEFFFFFFKVLYIKLPAEFLAKQSLLVLWHVLGYLTYSTQRKPFFICLDFLNFQVKILYVLFCCFFFLFSLNICV